MGITPFNAFLAVHILAGAIALIIAPLAMVTVKGGLWHRRWGKIYFWAMAVVAASATVLCWLRTGIFLFLIAILSFYLALTGYRVLNRKQPGAQAQFLDHFASAVMVLAGIGFVLVGFRETDPAARWVRIVFGLITFAIGALDIVRFVKPSQNKQAWLLLHMARFLGAYIATVTAFSVVNFQFLPYFWRWLWPTAIGTPAIILWTRQYKKTKPNA